MKVSGSNQTHKLILPETNRLLKPMQFKTRFSNSILSQTDVFKTSNTHPKTFVMNNPINRICNPSSPGSTYNHNRIPCKFIFPNPKLLMISKEC